MTNLCDLAKQFGTDKAWPHWYTPHYFERIQPEKVKNLLEIGICFARDFPNHRSGASLYMWEEFCQEARIFGIDIDPQSMVNSGRIQSFVCDQSNTGALYDLARTINAPLDIIVDDGSHVPKHQLTSLHALLPFVSNEGIYFIEDVHSLDVAQYIKDSVPTYDVEIIGEKPHDILMVIQ